MITSEETSHLKSLNMPEDLISRIAMTVSCSDSNDIEKVANSGQCFEEADASLPYRYQLMHNGLRVIEHGYHGQGVTEIIRLLKGHHEPQEEKAFHEVLKHINPGSSMLELGSHWSYYSLWFHKSVPNAVNFMVEPDPNNLEVGKKNFSINGFSGSFFNAFVGDKNTQPVPFHCESDLEIRSMRQIGVDDFLVENKIERVELLLTDIQGWELAMLKGAIKSIKSGKIRFLFLSTHHHAISHDPLIHQKCLQMVLDLGGHVILEHSISESFSGDGLIVVSFDAKDRALPHIEVSKNLPRNALFPLTEHDLAKAWQERDILKSEKLNLEESLNALRNEMLQTKNSRVFKALLKMRAIKNFLKIK